MEKEIQIDTQKCTAELEELLPMMEEACEIAKKIDKKELDKIKAVAKNPPAAIMDVLTMIYFMLAGNVDEAILIEVDKNRLPKKQEKNAIFTILNDINLLKLTLAETFINKIKTFKVHPKTFENLGSHPSLSDYFKPELKAANIKKTESASAANCQLYLWCYNVYQFYCSAKVVEPKQLKLNKAKEEYAEISEKLKIVQAEVKELKEKLEEVKEVSRKAASDLQKAKDDEFQCKDKLELARRFINALGSSNERWQQNIIEYDEQLGIIIGDILIASAFVSYCGPFPKKYREIIKKQFLDFVADTKIPISPLGIDPLNTLTNDAQIAVWNNQKLPADPVSIENGAILTNSKRWSLMIDPQLQGIKWIREKEKNNGLTVLRMNSKKLISKEGK